MDTYTRRRLEMFDSVVTFGKKPELALNAGLTALFAQVELHRDAIWDWMEDQVSGQGGLPRRIDRPC